MKSELRDLDKRQSDEITDFPCLGMDDRQNVVFFESKGTGWVVSVGSQLDYEIGYVSTTWHMCRFKRLNNQEVVLSNS